MVRSNEQTAITTGPNQSQSSAEPRLRPARCTQKPDNSLVCKNDTIRPISKKSTRRRRRSENERIEASRVENLLDRVRGSPCTACGRASPSDPDHISTRGSGGSNSEENLWALCRDDHTLKGQIGLTRFVERYKALENVLRMKGWRFCEFRKKWLRDGKGIQ